MPRVLTLKEGGVFGEKADAIKGQMFEGHIFTVAWKEGKRRKVGRVVVHELEQWDHPEAGWGARFHLHRKSTGALVAHVNVDWVHRGSVYVNLEKYKDLACYTCCPIVLGNGNQAPGSNP